MSPRIPQKPPPAAATPWWVVALLLVAGAAVYANSLGSPLVFDDRDVVERNPTIRTLTGAWFPPKADGMTVSGRPLVNVSLALNYATSGTEVWSYHLANIAIHLAAGLVLYGVLRRLLPSTSGSGRAPPVPPGAPPAALAVTLLWLVHPLQTEAVSYIAQRAESLMSLCLLLTLYAFLRAAEAAEPRVRWRWQAASVAACLAGMLGKEVMVVAPVLVLACDRVFVGGSFGAAWRARRGYYAALALTWLPLAWLVAGSAGRGGTAGLSAHVSSWDYALTQCGAIAHYLWLSLWPHPLVFDYGVDLVQHASDVLWPAAVLAGLLVSAVVAWRRHPPAGFAFLVFFAVLAPSSSVVPVATQTMAEHRMYLALAPVLALAVAALFRWTGRAALAVCVIWTVALGAVSIRRNQDYQSELGLWQDTVAKRPLNARAHANLGKTLSELGRETEAIAALTESLRLRPEQPLVHFNAGLSLTALGRTAEARQHYAEAVRLDPSYVDARINLGFLLLEAGAAAEALPMFAAAAQLAPGMPEAQGGWGSALAQSGRWDEAGQAFERALQLQPEPAVAASLHYNLGNVRVRAGQLAEAAAQYAESVRLDPGNAGAQYNLGAVLLRLGRGDEAVPPLEAALRLQPGMTPAQEALRQIRQKAPGP